jgi:integrase
MRKHSVEVRPYAGHTRYSWVINTWPNGKRKRLFFETRKEADDELERIEKKIDQEGKRALAFTDRQRVDALHALELLKGHDCNLEMAATFWLEYHHDDLKSRTVSEVTEEYLEHLKRKGRSELHRTDMRNRLLRFAKSFGNRPIKTLTKKELEDWVHSLKSGKGKRERDASPVTQNNYLKRIAAFLFFAERQTYIKKNPLEEAEPVTEPSEPVQIFTVEQMAKLLESADASLVPYLAIGAFAGLRSSEVLRLDWKEVRATAIVAEAHKTKKARRRVVPMPDNLLEWLAPHRKAAGPIFEGKQHELYKALKALCEQTKIAWKDNALRHSYCSYWLELHQKLEELALRMGHRNLNEIDSNYRELVTPEEAKAYFEIRPKSAGNIIPMPATA